IPAAFSFSGTFEEVEKMQVIRQALKRLSGWPDKPFTLKPGKGLTFHAEFERLPDDLHFFHLLEGSGEREGSWDFYDIELKALTGTR
ncbi:MAG: hypothetical protein AAFP92_31855, partial [Bacteroidota bacterium]